MKNTLQNTHSNLKKKKPTCEADVRTPFANCCTWSICFDVALLT